MAGRYGMVVGFTTACVISAYHHWCCEFESWSGRAVQHYMIKFNCQWIATDLWFSPGPPVFSTNKTYHYDITEILLKVVLNTIKQTNNKYIKMCTCEIIFLCISSILCRSYKYTKIYQLSSHTRILLLLKHVLTGYIQIYALK